MKKYIIATLLLISACTKNTDTGTGGGGTSTQPHPKAQSIQAETFKDTVNHYGPNRELHWIYIKPMPK